MAVENAAKSGCNRNLIQFLKSKGLSLPYEPREYSMRDIAEKAFWNYKDRLNLRRTLTSSESSLEGKLFVEFVALIYLSYINKKMIDGHLYSKYTMHELLDELDVIECYLEPGKAPAQGEVLMKQEQLYRDLGVNPLLARQK